MAYFIPEDSSKLLEKNSLKAKDIDNFSLRFNRFTQRDFNGDKRKYEFKIRDVNFSFDKQIDKIEKQQRVLKSFYDKHASIEVKNSWRLAIGIGTASVYETSITLHHIYGIPFIPAQSIKGSLRSYIIVNYFDCSEDKAFEDKGFVTIFGSNESQGKVIFFDAFTKESEIKMDIMNNHYQKYYNGSESPTDTQNPNPVNFLTLKNAKFEITVATKENVKIKEGLFQDRDILTLVKEELSDSLEIFGIGAKTAVGYGYFELIKSEEDKAWDRVKNSKYIKDFDRFIKDFATSKYVNDAEEQKKSLLKEIEDAKDVEKDEKFKKVNKEVEKAWENIHNPKYKSKLKKALEQFIKKWSKKQNSKGSEVVLEYVAKAQKELK